MRSSRTIAAGLLLACSVAGAVEPKAKIRGPKTAYVDWPITLRFNGTVGDAPPRLYLGSGPEDQSQVDFITFKDRKGFPTHAMMVPGKPGLYRFVLVAEGKPEGEDILDAAIDVADVMVIDPMNPNPPAPAPPGPAPEPGPSPPAPIPLPPDPGPAPPIPAPDPDASVVRVLLLHESSRPMTRGQENLWFGPELSQVLNTSTTADTIGRGGWRRFDVDVKIVREAPEWQAMMDAARAMLAKPEAPQLPVIVVFRGKKGMAYKFPEDVATLQNILKK